MEFKQTPKQQKKDLKYYIAEGAFWAIMYYLGIIFLVPYFIYLKASTIQIGLLNVLPIFFASIFGLLSYDVVKYFKSEKHFVIFFFSLQAFFWIPLAFVGYLLNSKLVIWLVIILYCLINILEQLPYPIYREWIGRVFNTNRIVEYTSKKQIILNLFSIVPLFLAGFLMDIINKNSILLGFTFIFIIAGAFRFFSVLAIKKMSQTEDAEDLKKESEEMAKPVFKVFKKEVLENKQFLYFLVIVSLIYFSMYIAAPYYRYYFLETLKFSYEQYILIEIGSILGLVLSFFYWGKICDKFGATKVLKAIILFLPLYPFLVIAFGNRAELLFLLNVFDGVLMAGLSLSIYGYIYQNIKTDMIHNVSFYMIFQATAMLLGTIVGGIISSNPRFWYMGIEKNGLLLIFVISILFRIFTIGFINRIEDKNKGKIDLPKDILLQKPIIFGLTKFYSFTKAEAIILAQGLEKEREELRTELQKEEKTIKQKIEELSDKEKEIFKMITSLEKQKTGKNSKLIAKSKLKK
jgi:hypothetical protein